MFACDEMFYKFMNKEERCAAEMQAAMFAVKKIEKVGRI